MTHFPELLDFGHRAVQPDAVLVRELGGELVLLNLDTESYFGLDEVGARMWAALTGSATLADAYDELLLEYDVPPQSLRVDFEALVRRLGEAGLIRIVGG